jgi:hypothetical protein
MRNYEARIENPRKCPWCGSYHIITMEKFERMVGRAEELIEKGLPARFPRIDIIRAIVQEYGLLKLLKADELLNLEEAIFKELEKRHGSFYAIFGELRWKTS